MPSCSSVDAHVRLLQTGLPCEGGDTTRAPTALRLEHPMLSAHARAFPTPSPRLHPALQGVEASPVLLGGGGEQIAVAPENLAGRFAEVGPGRARDGARSACTATPAAYPRCIFYHLNRDCPRSVLAFAGGPQGRWPGGGYAGGDARACHARRTGGARCCSSGRPPCPRGGGREGACRAGRGSGGASRLPVAVAPARPLQPGGAAGGLQAAAWHQRQTAGERGAEGVV